MTSQTIPAMILATLLGVLASPAQADKLPMPPTFAAKADAERTLRAYPLGVITRQAAFSHHGKAHREVKLPNGFTGWVYDLGGEAREMAYGKSTGERRVVQESGMRHGTRTYTLVFDSRGLVVDVLYDEAGRDGLDALALQHIKGTARTEDHTHPGGP